MYTRLLLTLFLLTLTAGCTQDAPAPDAEAPAVTEAPPVPEAPPATEVLSLFGTPLVPPPLSPERQAQLEADLAAAQAVYDRNPGDADAAIWLGRRTAYLWRYREAIDLFTEGLRKHPDDPRLYRHRGHRYLTVRDFDRAVADLERAAQLIEGTPDEIEPDGAPNAAGIPTSTLHTNIFYHLGLAYYLKGDFENALTAYRRCLDASDNNDMYVATADWLYMTLRRLGRDDEAADLLEPISGGMDLLENTAYHRRLLMYKGELDPEALLDVGEGEDPALTFATQGYGVGNWYLYNGRTEQAAAVFRRVLEGSYWAAFGYLAAEADLKRMGNG